MIFGKQIGVVPLQKYSIKKYIIILNTFLEDFTHFVVKVDNLLLF